MSIRKRLKHPLAKVGLWVLIIGSGPLVAFILLDLLGFPVSDNPIGLGLLFFFTSPIGMLLLIIGLITGDSKDDESSEETPRYRIDPVLAAKVMDRQKAKLTAEEELYVNSGSIGAGWGLFYFMFLGVTGAFFRHLPANFVYTNVMRHGRQQAWDEKNWENFEQFKRLNDRADSTAAVVLVIGISLLTILMFL